MIIKIGTEVDESRIMWKYSEDDTWKSAGVEELIDSYENNHAESYEMQIDDLKKEMDELKREIHYLKERRRHKVRTCRSMLNVSEYDCYVPSACRGCSNHTSNGGSGICNCTLGGHTIT